MGVREADHRREVLLDNRRQETEKNTLKGGGMGGRGDSHALGYGKV